MKNIDIHQKQDLEFVENEWKKWQDETDISSVEDVDESLLKQTIVEDLSFVSKMTVQEYTLYQKWTELHQKYPTTKQNTLFGEEVMLSNPEQNKLVQEVKNNIWIPESPEDYLKLQPVLEFTDDSEKRFDGKVKRSNLSEKWNTLRTFTHSQKNNSNIGRQLFFIVKDNVTGKYLGGICISGDFMDLGPRDRAIGWERNAKTFDGMINHTAIGSSIVPTQPLGFSYTGGKLLAYLCLSEDIQNLWEEKYGDKLVGVTTTSLYGKTKNHGLSQYDGLKYWKRMGFTEGSVSFEPKKETKTLIKQWLKKNHTRKYWEWYHATRPNGQPLKRDHKNRSYMFTYSKLNVPKEIVKSEHQRGVYFTRLYENTYEYLRGEIKEEQLKKRFDCSTESLVKVWKNKHASKRVKTLVERNQFSKETLYYDDVIFLSWEETKEKYLKDVGR